MDLEEEHRWDVDALEDDELNGMNGGHGEGGRLLVRVMELVEVPVEPWPVENSVAPVGQVVLLTKKFFEL